MAKRRFRPEDANRLKSAADPQLSPDAGRVAFVHGEVDEEKDRVASSIWVVAADGGSPPRPFSEGPADRSPRWSPDGRWLAYLSTPEDKPTDSHVRVAPLDGGTPRRLGELPGPVSQLAWSPDSSKLAVICTVGGGPPPDAPASVRNAPRTVRGLAARLDGVGWRDGRRHLFVLDLESGAATQLTHGEFDHADPSFSPDGSMIACTSDRHPRRDDRQFGGDIWLVPADGRRARRLTDGKGRVSGAAFSQDGRAIAFAGQLAGEWDRDQHVFVALLSADGVPSQVTPGTDRGVAAAPGLPPPYRWVGERELLVLLADRGRVRLHRASLDRTTSEEIIGGDLQIDGFSAVGDCVVYSATWPDRPSEVFLASSRSAPIQLTHLNDALLEDVELAPVGSHVIARPDGTEVEYFTLLPPRSPPRRRPLHLDIHGGPHGFWPAGRFLALHQAFAAAGYAVVLPNPRGSTSYGQDFTSACTGDWGGADFEDVLACCDDVVGLGVADPKRMFVSGYSYGGFMTAWIVGHNSRFRAASALAAVIDMKSMLTTDIPEFLMFTMGGTPFARRAEYELRSPLSYLERVTTPVLVMHWEGDVRVPISQGEELYAGLRLLGKEAELVRYPGGFHVARTPSQAIDWITRVLDWNARHDASAAPRGAAVRASARR